MRPTTPATKPRRGRPRKTGPADVLVTIALPPNVYDAYWRCAFESRQSVRAVLRLICNLHAPRE
jgi:hypothetical protein